MFYGFIQVFICFLYALISFIGAVSSRGFSFFSVLSGKEGKTNNGPKQLYSTSY